MISSILQLYYSFAVFELTHIDEFIDELLREDRVCDVILPRIQVAKRDKEIKIFLLKNVVSL